MDNPERKSTRLKGYDYSQNGAYFITICTKNRKPILSKIVVGEGLCALPQILLTTIGNQIEKAIQYINDNYNGVRVDKYVIMPNHVHMIIFITGGDGTQAGGHGNPPLQDIVGRLKSYTTKNYNEINNSENVALWQRSFYDHIIRDENEYLKVCEYIDGNPVKWEEDEYYGR